MSAPRRTIEKHQRIVAKTRAEWDAASSALTAWAIGAGYGNIRWDKLRPIAERDAPELVKAEVETRRAYEAAEAAAITAWAAYRGSFGLLIWY